MYRIAKASAIGLLILVGCGGGPVASVHPGSTRSPAATPSMYASPKSRPFVLSENPDVGPIIISFPTAGWTGMPGNRLVVSTSQIDTGIEEYDGQVWIYGDPCAWSTTMPDSPAITVDQVITALGSQSSRDASPPTDITIGEHSGQSITLHVPEDIAVEQLSSDNNLFPDCDDDKFATLTFGVGGVPHAEPDRFHQDAGQIDEFWVVDVQGAPVLFDLFYWPQTPQEVIDDLHAMVESATFGQ